MEWKENTGKEIMAKRKEMTGKEMKSKVKEKERRGWGRRG